MINLQEIIDDIATRINDIVAAKDEINIQNNKIIKKIILKARYQILCFFY